MERKTGASRNTSRVWCVACAGSLPPARAPSESEGSGLPPSRTTQEAIDASQNVSGSLWKGGKIQAEIRVAASLGNILRFFFVPDRLLG